MSKTRVPRCFRFEYDPAPDAAAIQALEKGEATPEQQQRALRLFLVNAAGIHETTFDPDSDSASHFMAGRRFAGQCIEKLRILNIAAFRRANQGGKE